MDVKIIPTEILYRVLGATLNKSNVIDWGFDEFIVNQAEDFILHLSNKRFGCSPCMVFLCKILY